MDCTDGSLDSASSLFEKAKRYLNSSEDEDWDNIKWSRVDTFLEGHYVLPDDYRKLQCLDEQSVDDWTLKEAVKKATESKAMWDADLPNRIAIIKKKCN